MHSAWQIEPNEYEIATDIYAGPLDLLLDLIQKAELDITKLAIAQVTDQFLNYIQTHSDTNPDYISAFMVTASKLIQIKSEALLPHPPVHEDEEDVGEALAQQLILYRQIKQRALWLTERNNAGLRSYIHVPPSFPSATTVDLKGLTIEDLARALLNLLNHPTDATTSSLINIPKLTLKQKVQEILNVLRQAENTSFQTLLGDDHSRINVIVVFLAILELVKQDLVKTEQNSTFADIQISANESLQVAQESEFNFED